jgi:hypothetical protein
VKSFGEWFQNERAAKNFSSQGAFAKHAKVGRSTVHSIEDGQGFTQRRPIVKQRIARALGHDVLVLEEMERALGKRKGGKAGPRVRVILVSEEAHKGLAYYANRQEFKSVDDWLEELGRTGGTGSVILPLEGLTASVSEQARGTHGASLHPERPPDQ